MATVDLSQGSAYEMDSGASARSFVVKRVLDCAKNNLGAGDVAQLIKVPAGCVVERVRWAVTTVEGGTLTFDIGDGADADGYIDGANGNALGSGASALALADGTPNTVVGYSGGKYYAANDTIDLTAVNAADAAVIEVTAHIVDMRG